MMYTYLHNLQGDIVGIVDNAGVLVVEYKYDAWGRKLSVTGSLSGTLGRRNPFRYRGYVWDEETGLYYLRSRYYNPKWKRFVNADTEIGEKSELLRHNVFAYCRNMPTILADETGRGWLFIAAVALIGAAVGAVSQIVSNILTDCKFDEGLIGAAVGGAVYNVVALVTNDPSLAAFSSSAAESLTNEVVDYISGDKEFTGDNILASSGHVLLDTAVNGVIYYGTGQIASRAIPTNNGWFQPKKVVSVLTGKYTKKVFLQTATQALFNSCTNYVKHDLVMSIAILD